MAATKEGDGCSFCATRLPSELARRETLRRAVALPSEAGRAVVTLPGTYVGGAAYYYRVELDSVTGLPTIVDQVRLDGKGLLSRFESMDYKPVPGARGLLFPRHFVLTNYDESREVSSVHYQITELWANRRIAKAEFTLSTNDAEIVLDAVSRKVLKHPQVNPADWLVP